MHRLAKHWSFGMGGKYCSNYFTDTKALFVFRIEIHCEVQILKMEVMTKPSGNIYLPTTPFISLQNFKEKKRDENYSCIFFCLKS